MAAIASVIVAVLEVLAKAIPSLSVELVRQWGEGAELARKELAEVKAERDRLRDEVWRLSEQLDEARDALRSRQDARDVIDRLGGSS